MLLPLGQTLDFPTAPSPHCLPPHSLPPLLTHLPLPTALSPHSLPPLPTHCPLSLLTPPSPRSLPSLGEPLPVMVCMSPGLHPSIVSNILPPTPLSPDLCLPDHLGPPPCTHYSTQLMNRACFLATSHQGTNNRVPHADTTMAGRDCGPGSPQVRCGTQWRASVLFPQPREWPRQGAPCPVMIHDEGGGQRRRCRRVEALVWSAHFGPHIPFSALCPTSF